ncbi:MAG TPA: monofunctional biosynthetic peptidoglycan transglycosylase [Gammaproteobacteria bacterium]
MAGARLKRKRGPLARVARGLVAAAALFIASSAGVVAVLRWIDPPTTAFMLLDTGGRQPLRYRWVDAGQMSPSLAYAVIAAEDQKFTEHFGFDFASIRESIDSSSDGRRLRGASTITQQVAKNLFLWPDRSVVRKGLEAYFTALIELAWTKERILEIYLNVAELGPGIYGVGAAADAYFAKDPQRVSDAEAALLAAVLPNPKVASVARPTPYLRERQRWILNQMQRLRRDGALAALRVDR